MISDAQFILAVAGGLFSLLLVGAAEAEFKARRDAERRRRDERRRP